MRVTKNLSFASQEQYAAFVALAQRHGLNPSSVCQNLADGSIKIGVKPSAAQNRAVLRGVIALIERGAIEDSRQLADLGMDLCSEPQAALDLQRLSGAGFNHIEALAQYVEMRQPFQLESNSGNFYACRYADFWVPDYGGGRAYLRAWVEDASGSSEPEPLAHNRAFRLDKPMVVTPVAGDWRFEGLDLVSVTLKLNPSFRSSPQPGDQVFASRGINQDETHLRRDYWSLFWLQQDIGRYGSGVVVIEPDFIRQRVHQELLATALAYEPLQNGGLLEWLQAECAACEKALMRFDKQASSGRDYSTEIAEKVFMRQAFELTIKKIRQDAT